MSIKNNLDLKFKAKDSSHFYSISMNKGEVNLLKTITHIDNHIILYKKAEKQNQEYIKEVKDTGKLYLNRDEAYVTLYDATKYTLAMENIYDIANKIIINSEELNCKLNGMHIYTLLKIITIIYNDIADKLIKLEDDYKNNTVTTKSYDKFVDEKNYFIEELNSIQKLDIKIRKVVNPKELTISKNQFEKSSLETIDGICKMRPKTELF